MKTNITPILIPLFLALGACAKQPESAPVPTPPTGELVSPSVTPNIEPLLPSVQQLADNADALELTQDERDEMVTAIESTQRRLASLDRTLQERTQRLTDELQQQPFDAELARSLGSEVIAHEAEIKQHHLNLLLKLRARLSRKQLRQLGVSLEPRTGR